MWLHAVSLTVQPVAGSTMLVVSVIRHCLTPDIARSASAMTPANIAMRAATQTQAVTGDRRADQAVRLPFHRPQMAKLLQQPCAVSLGASVLMEVVSRAVASVCRATPSKASKSSSCEGTLPSGSVTDIEPADLANLGPEVLGLRGGGS